MEGIAIDLRHGLRLLARKRGLTAAAVLTLGLGIGSATTMFAVLEHVVLRPLDYRDSQELVFLNESSPDGSQTYSVSIPNFHDWRERRDLFESLSAFRATSFNLTGGDEPVRVRAAMVSGELFETLGVEASTGRTFTASEDDVRLAVVSHGFWQRHLGGRDDALGARLTLDGRSFTVAGVMAPSFEFLTRTVELWVPIAAFRDELPWDERGRHPALWVVGRLAPGVTIEEARAGMAVLSEELAARYDHPHPIVVTSLHERSVGRAESGLLALMGSVVLVLLIACINVANLQIARASERGREMATRAALGAGRLRLAAQLVVESLLLSACGCVLGLLASSWGVDLVVRLLPENTPRLATVAVDGRTLVFGLAVALATGVLFGLAPLADRSFRSIAPALVAGRGLLPGRRRLARALVVAEVGLAVSLLVASGLLVKSFVHLTRTDVGFRTDDRVAVRLTLSPRAYGSFEAANAFYRDLLDRVQAVPGITTAAVSTGLPLVSPGIEAGVWSELLGTMEEGTDLLASVALVSPGYFEAMGIDLLSGRVLDERDTAGAARVAIVDESLERILFGGDSAVGKRLSVGGSPEDPRFVEIVGVVRHVLNYQIDAPQYVEVYLPLEQPPSWYDGIVEGNLVARHRGSPEAAIASIRDAVQRIDPSQPVYDPSTLSAIVDLALASERTNGALAALFAGAALALAAVGLYGLVSGLVASRTRELGLRMALGATPSRIVRGVLGEGLALALGGALVGLAGALVLAKLVEAELYEVSFLEPDVLLAALGVVVAATLAACGAPARRATRVETTEALRCD